MIISGKLCHCTSDHQLSTRFQTRTSKINELSNVTTKYNKLKGNAATSNQFPLAIITLSMLFGYFIKQAQTAKGNTDQASYTFVALKQWNTVAHFKQT